MIGFLGLPHCDDCGHRFDRNDRRCLVAGQHKVCPACHEVGRAMTAWAVVNDCQGVWPCAVYDREKQAEAALRREPYASAGANVRVEPVRIVVDPDPDLRRWQERAR